MCNCLKTVKLEHRHDRARAAFLDHQQELVHHYVQDVHLDDVVDTL